MLSAKKTTLKIIALQIFTFLITIIGVSAQNHPWINEISYDIIGSDTLEFIEIAGTTGTPLNSYKLYMYNGNDSLYYTSKKLSDTISGTGSFGTSVIYFKNVLQNGPADGIALIKDENTVIQFISYEGSIKALNGPALNIKSVDVGIVQNNESFSIQYQHLPYIETSNNWIKSSPSPGRLNESQLIISNGNETIYETEDFYFDGNGKLILNDKYTFDGMWDCEGKTLNSNNSYKFPIIFIYHDQLNKIFQHKILKEQN